MDYLKYVTENQKLLKDAKIFDNFSIILSKLEADGHLTSLSHSLTKMVYSEVVFALNGKLTRNQEIQFEDEEGRYREYP